MADNIHDMPDNYPWLPGSTRYPLADLGELAARLGSIVTYDRSGEVIWYDDFSRGLSGIDVYNDPGGSISINADYALKSAYGLHIKPAAGITNQSYIEKGLSPATLGKAGLELSFFCANSFTQVEITFMHDTGTVAKSGVLRLTFSGTVLTYKNAAGAFVTLGTFPTLVNSYKMFNIIKLVVDFDSGYYRRVLFNEQEYDLRGLALFPEAAGSAQRHYIQVKCTGVAAVGRYHYFGHILVTGNEP